MQETGVENNRAAEGEEGPVRGSDNLQGTIQIGKNIRITKVAQQNMCCSLLTVFAPLPLPRAPKPHSERAA